MVTSLFVNCVPSALTIYYSTLHATTLIIVPTLFIVIFNDYSNKGHLVYIVSLLICYSSTTIQEQWDTFTK